MAEALSLVVGDRVVYPNQGLCKVTAFETKEIGGQKLSFVTLQREEDGAKVMVPEAKVVAIGVRKVADPDEVAKVFAFLKSDSFKASLDWKARARTNVERMSGGGLMGLATAVKELQELSELRPLPTKERELYNDARHLLVAELAASLKVSEADAEDTVDVVLFPPGKERPKRMAEDFRTPSEGDDGLGMEGDLLGIDGDVAEESAEPEEPADAAADSEEAEEGEEKRKKKGAPEKPQKKASLISDVEVTIPQASPIAEVPAPRKRGRPPKPKPLITEPPPPPKKRGRPPKPKVEAAAPAEPKKRGRPPKAKSEPVAAAKKKK